MTRSVAAILREIREDLEAAAVKHAVAKARCLAVHNFYLEQGPGALFIFVPRGVDPADGNALTLARMAHPMEIDLWEEGPRGWEKLAVILQRQGAPVRVPRRPSFWRRLFDRFVQA